MSNIIPCFFLEPTGMVRLTLRRYNGDLQCPTSGMTYHNIHAPFMVVAEEWEENGRYRKSHDHLAPPHNDPRWPTACSCGYAFQESDTWQVFSDSIYRRLDTGEETTLRDAPPGALWYADWHQYIKGPDGHCLYCKTPGGDWCIDGRASNCTLPDDKEHRCWVRHGNPTDPLGLKTGQPLHVDKNGLTCQAGAGSIGCGQGERYYHGFLHDGHLRRC